MSDDSALTDLLWLATRHPWETAGALLAYLAVLALCEVFDRR